MGVTPAKVAFLSETFSPFYFEAVKAIKEAGTVNVTSSDQVDDMRKAGQLREILKEIRIGHEKTRKIVKADALAEGQAIDTIARHIREMIEPVEARMKMEEDFARREKELAQAKLKAEREEKLRPMGVNTADYNLESMSEGGFNELFEGLNTAYQARLKWQEEEDARLLQEETDRIHRENELAKENARLRAEQAKLQQQIDADAALAREAKAKADAKLKLEKEKAAAVLKAEQARSRQLELDAEKVRTAEALKVQEQQQALVRAANAPDREKLLTFAAMVRDLPLPAVTSLDAQKVVRTIQDQQTKFVAWMESYVKREL